MRCCVSYLGEPGLCPPLRVAVSDQKGTPGVPSLCHGRGPYHVWNLGHDDRNQQCTNDLSTHRVHSRGESTTDWGSFYQYQGGFDVSNHHPCRGRFDLYPCPNHLDEMDLSSSRDGEKIQWGKILMIGALCGVTEEVMKEVEE